jgi:hypothetical protein
VGIGTTSPDAKLSLKSPSVSGTQTILTGVAATSSTDLFALTVNQTTDVTTIGTPSGYAAPFAFQTNGSERMRITSNGAVLIGTTSNFAPLTVFSNATTISVFKNPTAGGYVRECYTTANSGTYYFDFFARYDTSANLGSISSNGTVMSYATTSDMRLKENIVNAPTALTDLEAIKVRSFDWKTDNTHEKFGFVAQELIEVVPNAVVKGQTEDDMWGVGHANLVPLLVKAIQEQQTLITALTARITALENR